MKTLFLALCLTATPALAQQQPVQPPPRVIVTAGEGIVKRAPDRVWVTVGAESRGRTAPEAQKLNVDAMTAVLDKIRAAGIAADAIQTTGVSLNPEFDFQNGKQTLRGYVARNQVQIRVDDMQKVGDILSAAVGTGATNVSGLRFDLKNRDAAESDALRMAVRDSRRRADAAASGASVEIGGVVRIEDQGVSDVMPPMPMARTMAMPAAAPVPVEGGEIEIRARVTVTYAIK